MRHAAYVSYWKAPAIMAMTSEGFESRMYFCMASIIPIVGAGEAFLLQDDRVSSAAFCSSYGATGRPLACPLERLDQRGSAAGVRARPAMVRLLLGCIQSRCRAW